MPRDKVWYSNQTKNIRRSGDHAVERVLYETCI